MAAVVGAPVIATLIVVDGEGSTSNVTLHFDGGATMGTVRTYLEAFQPILSALTTGSIVSASISQLTNQWDIGTPQGDVEIGARLHLQVEDTTKVAIITIPAAERGAGLLPDSSDQYDMTHASVVALEGALVTGLGGTTPRDSETRPIIGIKAMVEAYSRKRK